mmetsp:Transcript_57534/g.66028  ORF Transcript_57534/g.66028 Transcript_57534/m.66028 type:complete len:204 (-) Transcript_57534:458-1069(-)
MLMETTFWLLFSQETTSSEMLKLNSHSAAMTTILNSHSPSASVPHHHHNQLHSNGLSASSLSHTATLQLASTSTLSLVVMLLLPAATTLPLFQSTLALHSQATRVLNNQHGSLMSSTANSATTSISSPSTANSSISITISSAAHPKSSKLLTSLLLSTARPKLSLNSLDLTSHCPTLLSLKALWELQLSTPFSSSAKSQQLAS